MIGVCSICGRERTVYKNRRLKVNVCTLCFRKDAHNQKPRSACGDVKAVAAGIKSGQPICHSCYQQSKVGICDECKQTKVIQALGKCYGCYQRKRRSSMNGVIV